MANRYPESPAQNPTPSGWEISYLERLRDELRTCARICTALAALGFFVLVVFGSRVGAAAALALICLFLTAVLYDSHTREATLQELRLFRNRPPVPNAEPERPRPPAGEELIPEWLTKRSQEQRPPPDRRGR